MIIIKKENRGSKLVEGKYFSYVYPWRTNKARILQDLQREKALLIKGSSRGRGYAVVLGKYVEWHPLASKFLYDHNPSSEGEGDPSKVYFFEWDMPKHTPTGLLGECRLNNQAIYSFIDFLVNG